MKQYAGSKIELALEIGKSFIEFKMPLIKSSMSRIAGQIMMIASLIMTVEVAPDLLIGRGLKHLSIPG